MRFGLVTVTALMAYASTVSALKAQEAARDGFEQALAKARAYPIQWNTPGDCERAIALFDQVIAAYPEHAQVAEAKLGLFTILAISEKTEHLERANSMIKELVRSTDAGKPLGYTARLELIYFQTDRSRHRSFEDLPSAWDALGEIEQAWDRKSLEWANAVTCRARLLRREGKNVEALRTLSEYYRVTYEWPREFWLAMRENDPVRYRAFRKRFQYLNNEIVMALNACRGPEASRVLRSAHPGFTSNPRVMAAWKEYEEKYILGEDETFETMRERVYREGMERLDVERIPGSANGSPSVAASQPSEATSRFALRAAGKEDDTVRESGSMVVVWWIGGITLLVGAVAAITILKRKQSSQRRSS